MREDVCRLGSRHIAKASSMRSDALGRECPKRNPCVLCLEHGSPCSRPVVHADWDARSFREDPITSRLEREWQRCLYSYGPAVYMVNYSQASRIAASVNSITCCQRRWHTRPTLSMSGRFSGSTTSMASMSPFRLSE